MDGSDQSEQTLAMQQRMLPCYETVQKQVSEPVLDACVPLVPNSVLS